MNGQRSEIRGNGWIEIEDQALEAGSNEVETPSRVNGVAETVDLLARLDASDYRQAGECAKQLVESRYNLNDIARMYLEMWTKGREKKVASRCEQTG